ncbi:50S ribosomal protein L13, partial [bacterium]
MRQTTILKADEITKKWYVVDASGKTLGRLATRIATVLRGKNKVGFVPFMDHGDFVIVVNAEKVHVTGNKREAKVYW